MWRSALIGAALGFAATGAQAGEASDLASRGAFLLGHAYRCGVKAEQLQASAQLIHDLSAALAGDEGEKAEADKAFVERFVVSAVADSLGALLPSCASVKRDLTELEHHNPETVASGTSSPPEQSHLTTATPSRGVAKPARAARIPHSGKPLAHRLASRQAPRHPAAI
ncbi:MAG TPA: hypothetical protein VHU15_11570 [Stellaceae bacterium]|jgi:predicted RecA/RadA family phage recombinase|nr:hypothetical protein [Stellaceae bacterium]